MANNPVTLNRQRAMLLTAMGPIIGGALRDKSVIEIMANPDGSLWLDKHGEGRVQATTDSFVKKIDEVYEKKEAEIMHV